MPACRRRQDRAPARLADGLAEAVQHLALADRALLEILGEQVVVGLGGGLEQLLAGDLARSTTSAGNLRSSVLPSAVTRPSS
jgi:hypothetical protein